MKKHRIDYFLVAAVFILLIFGILILASVSAITSQEKFGRTTYYLFHQFELGIIPGLILGFIALKIKLPFLKKIALPLIFFNLILMALVFIPGFGVVAGGAPRWMNLRFFTFQPSEFLKLTFIIYLSLWLSNRAEKKKVSFIPFLTVVGVVASLLIFQLDLSTLGIILISALIIYFAAETPLWQSFLMVSSGLGLCLVLVGMFSYRMNRVAVWLNQMKDPMGIGYQLKQILIAVGSGGIFGLGLGMSSQKWGYIPQTMSDSIFAIIAEETGFLGSLLLILAFLFILWRGFKIAKGAKDKFSQFFAIGFTSWICLQAFVNIGAMIGVVPLTGIPLPFISYGGSHIVVEMIGVGILLNISKK